MGYDSERLSVMGSYTFVDDKGKEHKVEYVADEKGYRAKVKYSTKWKKGKSINKNPCHLPLKHSKLYYCDCSIIRKYKTAEIKVRH